MDRFLDLSQEIIKTLSDEDKKKIQDIFEAIENARKVETARKQVMEPVKKERVKEVQMVSSNTTTETTNKTRNTTSRSAKYGRDSEGRALKRDGTPRKGRSDKGKSRNRS